VSVSVAPILASVVLGGPVAAGIVGLVGTTDAREIRREVPWYGTLFNHAAIAIAAVVAGLIFESVREIAGDQASVSSGLVEFAGLLAAAVGYFAINGSLAVIAVSARTGVPFGIVWAQDVRAVALNLVGLAPLAWLMAEIFKLPNGVGWWATPLFVVPLFTTRLAYHRYVETRELFEQTIGALASAVDARDRYTAGHSTRVSHLAEAMCRALKLPEREIEVIKWAGQLHDVGKIGIRDHVLLKEGPLDKDERILMNQHPKIGADIVRPARQLAEEEPLIHAHHEWFNGSGYPSGMEATDIPLGARLLGVADAYEAMTSARPYRKTPLSHEIAIGELTKYSGIQFDPQMVEVFLTLPREVLDWRPENADVLPHEDQQGDGEVAPDTERPAPTATPEAETPATEGNPPSRPMIASDDVS
jgi:putative nucleotidyltransferase with HDIG domain